MWGNKSGSCEWGRMGAQIPCKQIPISSTRINWRTHTRAHSKPLPFHLWCLNLLSSSPPSPPDCNSRLQEHWAGHSPSYVVCGGRNGWMRLNRGLNYGVTRMRMRTLIAHIRFLWPLVRIPSLCVLPRWLAGWSLHLSLYKCADCKTASLIITSTWHMSKIHYSIELLWVPNATLLWMILLMLVTFVVCCLLAIASLLLILSPIHSLNPHPPLYPFSRV